MTKKYIEEIKYILEEKSRNLDLDLDLDISKIRINAYSPENKYELNIPLEKRNTIENLFKEFNILLNDIELGTDIKFKHSTVTIQDRTTGWRMFRKDFYVRNAKFKRSPESWLETMLKLNSGTFKSSTLKFNEGYYISDIRMIFTTIKK